MDPGINRSAHSSSTSRKSACTLVGSSWNQRRVSIGLSSQWRNRSYFLSCSWNPSLELTSSSQYLGRKLSARQSKIQTNQSLKKTLCDPTNRLEWICYRWSHGHPSSKPSSQPTPH